MRCFRNKRAVRAVWAALAVAGLAALCGGCIADTAADSDLPWATNRGWEGMAPLPMGVMDRYD